MPDQRPCLVLLFFAALSSAFLLETLGQIPSIRTQYKRFRSDLGKRDWEDVANKRRSGFRTDLGKRASFWSGPVHFRGDMGKRFADHELENDYDWETYGNEHYTPQLLNAIKRRGRLGFRADLGKRTLERLTAASSMEQKWRRPDHFQTEEDNPSESSEKRNYFRSDLGKRPADSEGVKALQRRLMTA